MATILENVYTLSAHLEDAYTALEGKGATIPQQKNATNLSATVDSLPAAGITVDDLLQPSSAQVEELKDFVVGVPAIDAALTSSSLTSGPGYALFANRASIIKTADFEELSSIGNRGCQFMFYNQRNLQSVSGFHPTVIQSNGCRNMFQGCTSLSSFYGALSVATANSSVGQNMFLSCTSLMAAPALPATTLGSECYRYMFYGCSSLTSAPVLPATILAGYCYDNMFSGCTSLSSGPALNIARAEMNCCSNMFSGCTALQSLPSFTRSSTQKYAYQNMFNGCTSFTGPLPLFEEIPFNLDGCFYQMYKGCTSLTGSVVIGVSQQAFATPAYNVFNSMFADCPNIQKVTLDFTVCTSVPSLGNVANINVFNNTSDARLEIRVPASLESSWKTATNWSTYSERIVGV